MGFQIRNKKGIALSMDALDLEAANFFRVDYDEEKYAKPSAGSPDWYSTVGYAIYGSKKEEKLQWSDVIAQILKICLIYTNSLEELEISFIAYKPFISLCYYWKAKGYTPVYVP